MVDFWRRGPFLDRELAGVLHPVPVSVKSETPSSRARRGVCAFLAIFDFGESRCEGLEADLVKIDVKFPLYIGLEVFSDAFLSGVNGEEPLLNANVVVRVRGEGVNGMRPPAVRVENL